MLILLVVNLQTEYSDNEGQYDKIMNYITTQKKYDKVIATKNVDGCDLPLMFSADLIIETQGFNLKDYILLDKEDEYHVIGYGSDSYILSICSSMKAKGYNFKVLSDFVYTNSSPKEVTKNITKFLEC